MRKSTQTIIKIIVTALWSVIDYMLYVAGLFDDLDSLKFVFALILWVVIWLVILTILNWLFKD